MALFFILIVVIRGLPQKVSPLFQKPENFGLVTYDFILIFSEFSGFIKQFITKRLKNGPEISLLYGSPVSRYVTILPISYKILNCPTG